VERQRVLPVATVSSSSRRHLTPSVLSNTATTSATTTTATATPSGESTDSRVLPPVNVPDVLSRDQLRQHTERIYWRMVHKGAVPMPTYTLTVNTAVCKDATPTFVDTVSATTTAVSDSVVTVNNSGCDTVGESRMSQVSASVSSDTIDINMSQVSADVDSDDTASATEEHDCAMLEG